MAERGPEANERWTDRLRHGVILTGAVAILSTVVSSVFWLHDRPDPASAGAPTSEQVTAPAPRASAAAPDPSEANVVHADVYFDFKSTRLRADAVSLLQKHASLVKPGEPWTVLVQGHADTRGPAEYNRQLARRRAQAVKQFLIELGVPDTSIKVVTLGQEGAICDDPGIECQQLNRRVHLELRKLPRAAAALQPLTVQPVEDDAHECAGEAEEPDDASGAASPLAK